MCGIVGIISKQKSGFFQTDINMFQNMLTIDSLRGEDSTGVFGVYKNLQAKTIKVAAEPHMLFRTEEWRAFTPKAISSMRILIGHNRYATKGKINNTNAHPFDEGKIVLVHNGTIHNQYEFNTSVEVDSHAIAHALNERPAKEVLSEIDGAFALAWYNREEGKVFVARNEQRPLHYVNTSNAIYIGSEAGMLEYLLNRNNGTVVHKAYAFPIGKLISFDTKGETVSEDFKLYSPKPVGGYPAVYPPGTTTWRGTNWRKNTDTYVNPTSLPPLEEKGKLLSNKTKVLVSISSISLGKENSQKCIGKLVYPSKDTDFSGTFSEKQDIDTVYNMAGFNKYAEGEITGSINTTCGLSYYVHNIKPAETIDVYNRTKLPKMLWDNICSNHKCDKCGAGILTHEASMTSVKIKNLTHTLRVVCCDCVMEALDEKTRPDNFENSSSPVQDYEQISQRIESWVESGGKQESIIH